MVRHHKATPQDADKLYYCIHDYRLFVNATGRGDFPKIIEEGGVGGNAHKKSPLLASQVSACNGLSPREYT